MYLILSYGIWRQLFLQPKYSFKAFMDLLGHWLLRAIFAPLFMSAFYGRQPLTKIVHWSWCMKEEPFLFGACSYLSVIASTKTPIILLSPMLFCILMQKIWVSWKTKSERFSALLHIANPEPGVKYELLRAVEWVLLAVTRFQPLGKKVAILRTVHGNTLIDELYHK